MPDLDDLLTGDLLEAWEAEARSEYLDTTDLSAKARELFRRSVEAHRRIRDEYVSIDDLIPRRFAHAAITHPAVQAWAAAVARNWLHPVPVKAGPSLLLSGPTGRGKTHQVYGARRWFHEIGVPASWTITTAADLNGAIRRFDGTDARDFARSALLAIDDLGAGSHTQFNDETLFRIVNHRYEQQLPTLITTNLPGAKIQEVFGERIAARLREMCGLAAWTMGDRDWRQK